MKVIGKGGKKEWLGRHGIHWGLTSADFEDNWGKKAPNYWVGWKVHLGFWLTWKTQTNFFLPEPSMLKMVEINWSLYYKAFLQVHKEIIISSLYACLVPTHYYSHLIIIIFLFSSHYSHLFVSIPHIISWVQTWYHAHFCVLRVRAQGLSNNNSRKFIESKGLGGLF